MTFWSIAATIFGAGCIGGVFNSLIAGEFHLPRTDRRARVWRPGWVGNVVVGGAAAVVFWGLYGPVAGIEVIGATSHQFVLRGAELFGAVLTGIGGGRLLSAEVDRRVLRSEKAALNSTKEVLADVIEHLEASRARDNK